MVGHINAAVKRSMAKGLPVISVDTNKKELIGNYDNAGQQWPPFNSLLCLPNYFVKDSRMPATCCAFIFLSAAIFGN